MNRRGFLQSCLALAAAPAIVRADSLMRVIPRDTGALEYAEYQWVQVSSRPIIVSVPDNLAEIVSETLRKHRDEIAASIVRRNALLAAMMREQLVGAR